VSGQFPPPGFAEDSLESIKDNAYFRNAENDAWFRFLALLQETPQDRIDTARSTRVEYVQLADQPDVYRGKLVTVSGWVRQVTNQTPAPNDLGIRSYFRVVVQPSDNAGWPIFVYCLELPAKLQQGELPAGTVSATGLFFKNLSYQWQNGLGIAPVIVAKRIESIGPLSDEPVTAIRPPTVDDPWTDAKQLTASSQGRSSPTSVDPLMPFRELLSVAGWAAPRLAAIDDGQPFSEDRRLEALQLLRRLRSFGTANLEEWVSDGLAARDVLMRPNDHRGQLVRLEGRVTKATKNTLAASVAERLEMPHYFECELALEHQKETAVVLTSRIPEAWLSEDELDEPATAVALYLKRLSTDAEPPSMWLAKEIAWHPTTVDEPRVSLGKSILGMLGLDVGLLDEVRGRGPILAAEREAFYRLLDAVGRIGAHQLERFAQGNLERVRERWARDADVSGNESTRALSAEVARRAAAGRYSVAPLFNQPERNIGQLVSLDGIARRVVRVEIAAGSETDPGDIQRRFGMDHYYELEVFTDDSQNYPIVFCARELPEGFPTGDKLHVPVRVVGFFFKDWLYLTRGKPAVDARAGDSALARQQYAPLIVGRSPLTLQVEQGGGSLPRIVGGGMFLLSLGGIWAAAWWFARGDRRFSVRARAADDSSPARQFLNQLERQAAGQSMDDSTASGSAFDNSLRLE
jgi:hypothetical protein